MKTIFKYIFSVALGSIMLTSCDLDTIPTTYVDAGSVFGKTGDKKSTKWWLELPDGNFQFLRQPRLWSNVTCK